MAKESVKMSSSLLAAAEQVARTMINNGQSIQKVNFGRGNGYYWIANEASLLIGPETLEIDGSLFYLSMFRADPSGTDNPSAKAS